MNKGVSFEKSKRKDHFLSKNQELNPSAATYFRNDNKVEILVCQTDGNPEGKDKLYYPARRKS